jgi:hypothetical protein
MNSSLRWVFVTCAVTSLLLVAIALHLWGAAEIRADPGEVVLLTGAGAVGLFLATKLFAWLGLSLQDDVVERRNVGALLALCGASMAVTIIYAGSSVGEGPSHWNNVFCTMLGTTSLLAFWLLLEIVGNISRSITEERDLASGLRLGSFLLASGLVFGRALAGDWESESATVRDFVSDGWPAAPLCAVALIIEKIASPSRRHPFPPWPSYGLLPALFYLAFAGAWLWHLGPWEGMPK